MFWAALFLPLIAGLTLLSFGQRWGRSVTVNLACVSVGLGFVASLATFWQPPAQPDQVLFPWLQLGKAVVEFGAWVDPLSITCC